MAGPIYRGTILRSEFLLREAQASPNTKTSLRIGTFCVDFFIPGRPATNESRTGLSYTNIGALFGVSRTHVREILLEAERAGFVQLSGRGGQLVQLTPAVIQVFDHFIADSLSGLDLMFQIALKTMASKKPSTHDTASSPR
jgi:hypothetical protein